MNNLIKNNKKLKNSYMRAFKIYKMLINNININKLNNESLSIWTNIK